MKKTRINRENQKLYPKNNNLRNRRQVVKLIERKICVKKFSNIIDKVFYLFDCLIILIISYMFITHLAEIFLNLIPQLFVDMNDEIYISKMSDGNITNTTNTTTQSGSSTTTTTIIHDDGSWSNTIRSLFIYGTGAYRLSLLPQGGSPSKRFVVIGSTLVAEGLTKVINNTINDPSYVKNHLTNWSAFWDNSSNGSVKVKVDDETLNKLSNASNSSSNFMDHGNKLSDLINTYINGFFEHFKFILEPVKVNYSNEILASQIHDLSVLLFMLSVIITVLIIVLIFNIVIYINMDKIIKYFNNKFVRWYLLFNKKIMGIEIFILGISIVYFMYTLNKGILFIATHPIIIN